MLRRVTVFKEIMNWDTLNENGYNKFVEIERIVWTTVTQNSHTFNYIALSLP